jgi:quinol monooxygenase YgiN
MLIVSGTVSVAPAHHDQMVELIAPLVEATRAEEGNLSYGFYADPAAPGAFRVYEEWESPEVMGTHMASDHMATFLVGMGGLDVTGTELYQHEVTGTTRLM